MKTLIRFLEKYHVFVLFIVLEFISLLLVVRSNKSKELKVQRISNAISGYIYDKTNFLSDYLKLREVNKQLIEENARIHNRNMNLYFSYETKFEVVEDTISIENNDSTFTIQQYEYTPAIVINNSVNKRNNYITLNKGRKHGIKPEMAVVSGEGVAGIVKDVSDNFALVLSVLNVNVSISAKIKKTGETGILSWDGEKHNMAILNDILSYEAPLNIGDTIVTSGYSAIFPEGIVIGKIAKLETTSSDNFYNISVMLATNFRTLNYVYVISNYFRKEQILLESKIEEND